MLTAGRLQRIKTYISPSNGNQSASTLNKFCCELVEEVERLRSVLQSLANANVSITVEDIYELDGDDEPLTFDRMPVIDLAPGESSEAYIRRMRDD